ncbi:MAG: transposase, partial [Ruminobacter sp.]
PISTGKLEGMNNKIKVAKRIAYGYRDEDYFFTLIRYQSSLGFPTIP